MNTTRTFVQAAVAMLCALTLLTGCQHTSAAAPAGPVAGTKAEHVNIGYGTLPSSRTTGSIASMKVERRNRSGVTQVEELLAGRVAGVQVRRLADGGYSVRVRGTTSFLGSNEPLWVIDGTPLVLRGGTALMGIDPHNVQRIEVLKDAGATAIYGSRGAAGVILVTTGTSP